MCDKCIAERLNNGMKPYYINALISTVLRATETENESDWPDVITQPEDPEEPNQEEQEGNNLEVNL